MRSPLSVLRACPPWSTSTTAAGRARGAPTGSRRGRVSGTRPHFSRAGVLPQTRTWSAAESDVTTPLYGGVPRDDRAGTRDDPRADLGLTGAHMNPVTPLTAGAKLRLFFTRRWRTSGFWFGLAITLLWPFTMFGTRVGWRGGEPLPRTGGALLAANHVSLADPIFNVAFCICHGRMPRFLAKAELWNIPVVRSVLAKGGHIPVYRMSTRAGDAYRDAIAAIQRGEVVVFYPEATYTADPDGWPMK